MARARLGLCEDRAGGMNSATEVAASREALRIMSVGFNRHGFGQS